MERLLATAITCAPVQALALVDVDGRIVGWNDAAAGLTGHTAGDAIVKNSPGCVRTPTPHSALRPTHR